MFLLIRVRNLCISLNAIEFTFHNVSINSAVCEPRQQQQYNLHSTMFLLILQPCRYSACLLVKFTFHNVSINSPIRERSAAMINNLHSTMFLLIPAGIPVPEIAERHLHSTMFLLIRGQRRLSYSTK